MVRPSDPAARVPSRAPARSPREKPDLRPARLMMGAGALAAATIITTGLVTFPPAVADSEPTAPERPGPSRAEHAERPVRYITLKRGQRAPKGATVIREAAPTPRVVVRRIVEPAPQAQPQRVARTRQSGGG